MDTIARRVERAITPQWVIEGAGVRLRRSIATQELDYLDPFLLLDDFGSLQSENFVRGFPMHPHRGIETVTYMITGFVEHRDSIGNSGRIGPGDVQWLTAGRGIMHEEMPKPGLRGMSGVQLWVNLPANLKMTRPHYQEIASDRVPEVLNVDGARIRVIAGHSDGVRGAVSGTAGEPTYLDVSLPSGARFSHPVVPGHTAFAYLLEGDGSFGIANGDRGTPAGAPKLLVLGDGETFAARASAEGARFLLVSGRPLHEPVARYGPFVMNTREEIQQALQELRAGTFTR